MNASRIIKIKKKVLKTKDRIDIIKLNENGTKSKDISIKYGVSAAAVSNIIKRKDYWLEKVMKCMLYQFCIVLFFHFFYLFIRLQIR